MRAQIAVLLAVSLFYSTVYAVEVAEKTIVCDGLMQGVRVDNTSLGQLVPVNPAGAPALNSAAPSAALSEASLVRTQMIKDLVTENSILFNDHMLMDFEVAYKQKIYGNVGGEWNFSLKKAAADFKSLSRETRLAILASVWKVTVEKLDLGLEKGKVNDALIVRFSGKLHIPLATARPLFQRLRSYETDAHLKAELLDVMDGGMETLLNLAPLYTRAYDTQFYRNREEHSPSRGGFYYADSLWRRVAIPATVLAFAALPAVFGVPWEQHFTGRYDEVLTYWHMYSQNPLLENSHMFWFMTWQAAVPAAGLVALPLMSGLRKLLKKFVAIPTLHKKLEASALNFQPVLDHEKILVENASPDQLNASLEQTVGDFGTESEKIMKRTLDPTDPSFAKTKYADFGESTVGERNLLASSQLFAIQALVARRVYLQQLGMQIQAAVDNGTISSLSQPNYTKQVFGKIAARKEFIRNIREDLTRVETFVAETNKAAEAFIAYSSSPTMNEMRLKSPSLDKNLMSQVQALQVQLMMSDVLNQALAKLEQETATEYLTLTNASNALTLINVAQGSGDLVTRWTELAAALQTEGI